VAWSGVQPSQAKQYVYCPVIPWIMVKYGVVEPTTDSMKLGREDHDSGKQVRVKSKRGVAVLDSVVEENGRPVIVEKKAFRSRSIHRYVVQVAVQYLVASEKLPGVRKAVLVNGDREHVIELSGDLIAEVEMLLERVARAVESDRPPQPTTEAWKCGMCWYSRFCPYS